MVELFPPSHITAGTYLLTYILICDFATLFTTMSVDWTKIRVADYPSTDFEKSDVAEDGKTIEGLICMDTFDHWRIYALLDGGKRAVAFHMYPDSLSPNNDRGELLVEAMDYTAPYEHSVGGKKDIAGVLWTQMRANVQKPPQEKPVFFMLNVPVQKPLTVKDLKDFIIKLNLHDFLFKNVAGCRFWTITLVDELARQSFVPENSADELETSMLEKSKQLADNMNAWAASYYIRMPTVRGTFPTFKLRRKCMS